MAAKRYRVLGTVGHGPGGTVWRARDELLGRDVAVRRLPPSCPFDPAHSDRARAKVIREARGAIRVRHPHALVVHDVFEHDGTPYVVTEFLAARTLADLLGREGTLPLERVAALGAQLASALAAAHAVGVLHRGIGPERVLVTEAGTAKIDGFGLGGGTASAAADVFSLGATLYRALEGRPPGSAVPPRTSGPVLDVVQALLRPEPATRPTMAEAARLFAATAVPGPETRGRTRILAAATVLAVALGTAVTRRRRPR